MSKKAASNATPTGEAPASSAPEVITPAEPAKMPQIDYTMDAKGKITRTDKDGVIHVADYDAKKKTLAFVSEETLRFRPPTVNYLNAQEPPIEIDHIILRDVGADKVDEASIPPKPKKSMVHGDKTPALVEWYRKYFPKEYAVRYGVKGPGQVTKYRKVENPKKPGTFETVAYQEDCIISSRKTHLTEKPEADTQTSAEYTDDDSIPENR